MALMAWSTVALGGKSIFAGVGAVVDADGVELAASAGDDAAGSLGVAVVVCDVDADSLVAADAGAGAVSGGGAEEVLPPHAANPKSSCSTSAEALGGSARRARN
jgi:hypothetical protein